MTNTNPVSLLLQVWQLGSSTPNFTLEGHEKGVNCVDYYCGGDKPYLISGADDRVAKIWDYQVSESRDYQVTAVWLMSQTWWTSHMNCKLSYMFTTHNLSFTLTWFVAMCVNRIIWKEIRCHKWWLYCGKFKDICEPFIRVVIVPWPFVMPVSTEHKFACFHSLDCVLSFRTRPVYRLWRVTPRTWRPLPSTQNYQSFWLAPRMVSFLHFST